MVLSHRTHWTRHQLPVRTIYPRCHSDATIAISAAVSTRSWLHSSFLVWFSHLSVLWPLPSCQTARGCTCLPPRLSRHRFGGTSPYGYPAPYPPRGRSDQDPYPGYPVDYGESDLLAAFAFPQFIPGSRSSRCGGYRRGSGARSERRAHTSTVECQGTGSAAFLVSTRSGTGFEALLRHKCYYDLCDTKPFALISTPLSNPHPLQSGPNLSPLAPA